MELIKKAILGDNKAFSQLYSMYRQEIFSFLLGRIRSREDALDLTADVFIAAYVGIKSFNERSSFRTWLYAVARHKLSDYYNKKGIENERYTEFEDSMGDEFQAEDNIQNIESKMDLEKILEKLKPFDQEILLLHNINGLKFSECAEILNVTEGSARVYHQRAMVKAQQIAQENNY